MMNPSLLSRLSDNHPLSEEDDYHWSSSGRDVLLQELKMLFNSRSRLPDIEEIEFVNASIINYGFNESFGQIVEVSARRQELEERLKNTIARFEPRLTQVSLTAIAEPSNSISFRLQAMHLQEPIALELKWDDYIGRFYFNE